MDILLLPVFLLFLLLIPALFLALLLYALPIRVGASLRYRTGCREESVTVSWCGLGVRISGSDSGQLTEVLLNDRVLFARQELPAAEDETRQVPPPAPDQAVGSDGRLNMEVILEILPRVTGPLGKFVSVVRQQSRFTGARGTVMLGLGDPALTGQVYGYYWASRFLFLMSRIDIRMQPVFDRKVLEMDVTAGGEIVHPLLVLFAGIGLARDPAIHDAAGLLKRGHEEHGGTAA